MSVDEVVLKERELEAPFRLENVKAVSHYLKRLLVDLDDRWIFLNCYDIDWVRAEGNYVRLYCGEKSYLVRRGIGELESKLDPDTFLRIHRSTIVNLNRIRELRQRSSRELTVVLQNGTRLGWSRGYRGKLKCF